MRATITITLDLEPTADGDLVDLQRPLGDLAAIMLVQAEDGIFHGGHPEATDADDLGVDPDMLGVPLARIAAQTVTVTLA